MLNITISEIKEEASRIAIKPFPEMIAILAKRHANSVKMAYSLAQMDDDRRALAEAIMDIIDDTTPLDVLPMANRLQHACNLATVSPLMDSDIAARAFVKSVAEAVGIRVGVSY